MKEDDGQMEDDNERIRFQKPKWPIDKAYEDPYGCIAKVFIRIHLDDFRDEQRESLRIALINDQSVYDEGPVREDVMDFCDELQLQMQALQVINMNLQPDDMRRWKKGLPMICGKKMKAITSRCCLQKNKGPIRCLLS